MHICGVFILEGSGSGLWYLMGILWTLSSVAQILPFKSKYVSLTVSKDAQSIDLRFCHIIKAEAPFMCLHLYLDIINIALANRFYTVVV